MCSCNNVDKGAIYRAVTEDGLTTVAEVKSFTKVLIVPVDTCTLVYVLGVFHCFSRHYYNSIMFVCD